MFDVGFSELLVIAVVGLIVIGPERLPKVARTAGHLLGRLQRYVSDVKADINREIQLEELKKMQQDVVDQAKGLENSMSSVTHSVSELEATLNQTIAPPAGTAPAQESAVPPAPTSAAVEPLPKS